MPGSGMPQEERVSKGPCCREGWMESDGSLDLATLKAPVTLRRECLFLCRNGSRISVNLMMLFIYSFVLCKIITDVLHRYMHSE